VLDSLGTKGVLAFYIDLYRITTLDRFAASFSQTVLSPLNSKADKIFSLLRSIIPSLKPKLTYKEPGMPSIELEMNLETLRQQTTLAEMFNLLENYCGKEKKRGCIVFDEFQEIKSFDPDGLLEREMRSAFQHHEFVGYAFLGSKTHLMHEIFKDKNRPFYNFGSHVELDVISAAEWIPFIEENFKKAGLHAHPDFFQQLIVCTTGHPYYTQMLCSEIWEQCVHSKGIKASDLLPNGLQAVLSKENHAFVEIWDSLSSIERRLLAAIAEKGSVSIFSHEFLRKYRLGAASSLQRVTERMTKRGIIGRFADSYRLIDPMLKCWIKQDDIARL
jgi:AAA+ ATPase superfamily predicted ATPase